VALRANSARVHGSILNLSYAYVSCAYEFNLRGRFSAEFWTVSSEQLLCLLESFVPFRVYRFNDFEVFWSSTVSVYRSRTFSGDYEGRKV